MDERCEVCETYDPPRWQVECSGCGMFYDLCAICLSPEKVESIAALHAARCSHPFARVTIAGQDLRIMVTQEVGGISRAVAWPPRKEAACRT